MIGGHGLSWKHHMVCAAGTVPVCESGVVEQSQGKFKNRPNSCCSIRTAGENIFNVNVWTLQIHFNALTDFDTLFLFWFVHFTRRVWLTCGLSVTAALSLPLCLSFIKSPPLKKTKTTQNIFDVSPEYLFQSSRWASEPAWQSTRQPFISVFTGGTLHHRMSLCVFGSRWVLELIVH